jgi:hypothetical protein
VRLDRKLLLIAPTIVLFFVIAGLVYAAMQLRVLTQVSDSYKNRSAFIGAVERGEKPLSQKQSAGLLRLAMDVEARRTAAITAAEELLIELASIAFVACIVLTLGIRSVPREHWPRLAFGRRAVE